MSEISKWPESWAAVWFQWKNLCEGYRRWRVLEKDNLWLDKAGEHHAWNNVGPVGSEMYLLLTGQWQIVFTLIRINRVMFLKVITRLLLPKSRLFCTYLELWCKVQSSVMTNKTTALKAKTSSECLNNASYLTSNHIFLILFSAFYISLRLLSVSHPTLQKFCRVRS